MSPLLSKCFFQVHNFDGLPGNFWGVALIEILQDNHSRVVNVALSMKMIVNTIAHMQLRVEV